MQRRRRGGERGPAGDPQPRRGAAARLRRGDPPALDGRSGLGGMAGTGRRRRRPPRQLGRQPDPLHRDRLGRRPRPARSTEAPPAGEVPAASGACLAIPLDRWRAVGGFPAEFFLYHEDVDLSVRLRSEGHAVGIEPTAVVAHDYEFGANEQKWFWLERNRLAFVVRTYPGPLLALLAPALLATELALLASSRPAAAGGGRSCGRTSPSCAGCRVSCASGGRSSGGARSSAPSSPPR